MKRFAGSNDADGVAAECLYTSVDTLDGVAGVDDSAKFSSGKTDNCQVTYGGVTELMGAESLSQPSGCWTAGGGSKSSAKDAVSSEGRVSGAKCLPQGDGSLTAGGGGHLPTEQKCQFCH